VNLRFKKQDGTFSGKLKNTPVGGKRAGKVKAEFVLLLLVSYIVTITKFFLA